MAFTNSNQCNTQKQTLGTSAYAALGTAAECSEVILVSTDLFYVKSSADSGTPVEMLVPANTYFTVRGITNATDVTVKGNSTSVLYARAQFYTSMTPIAS